VETPERAAPFRDEALTIYRRLGARPSVERLSAAS
jgi:hypothetical protein